ncbi:motility associated factor glycosyltransferase family protein [Campylobacter insulaenigrae]|uniref:motility associated factor glycosyltransferase family protein n=1 Tax=Campylobacter insulaenigrae TaxID=260714 RepID=UPI00215209C9|nr:motility associated factor glycosyltransferase family protein [Campylobacter insulaenigrae]MCR6572367.1 motility associated factor glycosyltransferase family protein [Campylobacter insulaenigrae]
MGGGINLNFINTKTNIAIYDNLDSYLQEKIKFYQEKYLLYPVLYFYGFGNGILYKCLLKNQNLKHIVVFEDDLELLQIALSNFDFSQELKEQKIIILNSDIDSSDLMILFQKFPFFNFLRVYDMHLHSDYYSDVQIKILKLNDKISQCIKTIILYQGDDIWDTIQGIAQFTYNMSKMITGLTLQSLLQNRNKKSKSAIIVSTGPSLTKQLPLLKRYQDNFSIFCVDSAYSILAKNEIKPDYVLMSERSEMTADLLKQNYENIDKNIVFILLTLVHPLVIKYLEDTKRQYTLTPYTTKFIDNLNLDSFGNLSAGSTVALNALHLACELSHENIIFIGQDLAYANDGTSHPKEYIYGPNYESYTDKESAKAYGGDGIVVTHRFWNMFRLTIQNYIASKEGFKFYNATEGGAHIEGTIEKPFKECCEEFLDKKITKPFEKPVSLDKNMQNDLLIQSYNEIKNNIKFSKGFIEEFQLHLDNLKQYNQKIYQISLFEEKKKMIMQTMQFLDTSKIKLDEYCKSFLYEFIRPFLQQFEFNLARIYVINPRNNDEWLNKNLTWIKDHIFLFEVLIQNIKFANEEILKNIIPLEEEIVKRNLKDI